MENKTIKKINPYLDKVVHLISIVLTIIVWLISVNVNHSGQLSTFNHDSEEVKRQLDSQFTEYVDTLLYIRGFFESSDNVTRDEFDTFVSSLDLESKQQEFIRISFVSSVPTKDIENFDKMILEEGYKNYKSNIVEGLENQYIVNFISDSKGNKYPPTGINLWNEKARIDAINFALENNSVSISDLVKIRNVPDEISDGIIIMVPVYKDKEVIGILNGLVSVKNFSKHFKDYLTDFSSIKLSDDQTVFFDIVGDSNIKNKKINTKSYDFVLFNQDKYKLEITKPVEKLYLLDIPNLVLGFGIIISILIYFLFYSVIRMNKKAFEMAASMTNDLYKFKLAIDNTDNHVVITDPEGVVVYANRAATLMTGFSLSEIIGNKPSLWGRQMPLDFYKRLWHTIKVEQKIFKGEIKNKRKNGEIYIAIASISPIIDENNNLIGFVGIEEDVTEERKTTEDLKKMNELMVGRELKMLELKKKLEGRV